MFMNLGEVEANSVLYCPFATYNSSGASVTITGLAATDIEIYKNGGTTQRASDAGYTLLDTDGIDFDGITGIHGFSVDLADNTTAGFYTSGSTYWIVVSAITVDSQTVNFGYYFTIRMNSGGRGTLSGTHSSTTADLGTNAPANDISGQQIYFPGHNLTRVIDSYNTGTGVATFSPSVAVTLTNGDIWTLFPSAPASTGAVPAVNVTQIGGDAQSATDLKDFADAGYDPSTNKVQGVVLTDTLTTYTGNTPQTGDSFARIGATGSGLTTLATQASVNAIDDLLDTEMPALTTAVADLPTNAELATALGTADDAVLASLSTLTTTLNATRYQKNTGSQKVFFTLVDSTDHVTREPGITVTATRSLDGAAFGSATGTVTEVGSGVYYLTPSAGDINADDVVYRFTGTGCDPVELHVVTY